MYPIREWCRPRVPFPIIVFKRNIHACKYEKKLEKIKSTVVCDIWECDRHRHPLLQDVHRTLYFTIQAAYYEKFGIVADILNPSNYNEKIQWLKLFDQSKRMISYCDKIAVKDFIANRVGEKYVPRTLQIAKRYSDLSFSNLPNQFVIKTNHDSGSVFLIKNGDKRNMHRINQEVNYSLQRTYGTLKGEWPYMLIEKKVFIEEYLDYRANTSPIDYKFHCVNGKVRWLQYIFDRGIYTKEIIFNREFERLPMRLDTTFGSSPKQIRKPENWQEMIYVAEQLANGFKYIRVDQYNIHGKVYVGELTFFPKAGMYVNSKVNLVSFGTMLDFDFSQASTIVYDRAVVKDYSTAKQNHYTG